jgi:hypothetical protein
MAGLTESKYESQTSGVAVGVGASVGMGVFAAASVGVRVAVSVGDAVGADVADDSAVGVCESNITAGVASRVDPHAVNNRIRPMKILTSNADFMRGSPMSAALSFQ